MRLSSQSSNFVFNLPNNFVKKEITDSYLPLLEKNWVQYEDVISYLNSTILSVNFPGVSIELPKQIMVRGKQVDHKPAKNIQDLVGNREMVVTFRSVDADLNYFIMLDLFYKHYMDVENGYLNPFTLQVLDIHRDCIYQIEYHQLIFKSLSENTMKYSQQKVSAKEFTATFNYNFHYLSMNLDKSKVLETKDVPTIIQKLK